MKFRPHFWKGMGFLFIYKAKEKRRIMITKSLFKNISESEFEIFQTQIALTWKYQKMLTLLQFKELLISQVVQQEDLTRSLVEKGMFTKEEFLGMVKNQGMKMGGRENPSGVINGRKSSFHMERGQR
jgi:hypothetical protein